MGRVIDWLKAQGFDIRGPADHKALIEKIESAVGSVWVEIDRLDGLPIGELDAEEVKRLQERVSKMQRGLWDGIRYGSGYRALLQQTPTRRRLDEAVRFLGISEVKVTELRGRLGVEDAARKAVHEHIVEQVRKPAIARWAKLDTVKEWAFEQRRARPHGDRAPLIREIAPTVRKMAKEAGEPLSGDDQSVIETITGWFRKAKIK